VEEKLLNTYRERWLVEEMLLNTYRERACGGGAAESYGCVQISGCLKVLVHIQNYPDMSSTDVEQKHCQVLQIRLW
jgi:hypothetical protein